MEENTKYLNAQELVLSTLDSELKKIFTEIHIKSRQIDLENKQLDRIKNKQEVMKFSFFFYILLSFFLLKINYISGRLCFNSSNAN